MGESVGIILMLSLISLLLVGITNRLDKILKAIGPKQQEVSSE